MNDEKELIKAKRTQNTLYNRDDRQGLWMELLKMVRVFYREIKVCVLTYNDMVK